MWSHAPHQASLVFMLAPLQSFLVVQASNVTHQVDVPLVERLPNLCRRASCPWDSVLVTELSMLWYLGCGRVPLPWKRTSRDPPHVYLTELPSCGVWAPTQASVELLLGFPQHADGLPGGCCAEAFQALGACGIVLPFLGRMPIFWCHTCQWFLQGKPTLRTFKLSVVPSCGSGKHPSHASCLYVVWKSVSVTKVVTSSRTSSSLSPKQHLQTAIVSRNCHHFRNPCFNPTYYANGTPQVPSCLDICCTPHDLD